MNSKVRNTVVASLAVVFGSLALALNNADLVTYLDYGAPRVQQEVRLVSTTPIFVGTGAGNQAEQANEQQLRRQLERLGIWVD